MCPKCDERETRAGGLCHRCYMREYRIRKRPPGTKLRRPRSIKGALICRHCQKKRIPDRRNLCVSCYRDSGIRKLYSPLPTDQEGYGTNMVNDKGLPEPTQTLPGTPERVQVLEKRARLGLALFHPEDAK